MRRLAVLSLVLGLFAPACAASAPQSSAPAPATSAAPSAGSAAPTASRVLPVETPRDGIVDNLGGHQVADPYRWLEDGSSERVQAWTDAQNAYARKYLDAIPGRAELHAGIERLLSIGDIEEPTAKRTRGKGWRYFYTKRTGLQNQPVLLMRDGLSGADRVVLDVNQLAADGTVALDWYYPSEDGRLVAYGTSRNGDEDSTLRVRDLSGATPRDLPDELTQTRHCSIAWKPDGSGFFYTRFPKKGEVPEGEEKYHRAVYEHRLGAPMAEDKKIFGDGRDMTDSPAVELSPDGRWLVLEVYQGWAKNELYVIDQRDPQRKLVPIAVGVEALYDAIALTDRLIVQTNEGAPRGRIVSIDPRSPSKDKWKELVAESGDAIETFAVTPRHIVVTYQHDASTKLETFDLQGKGSGGIALPTLGTATVSASRGASEVFFRFRSFVVPTTVFHVPLEGKGAGAPSPWQGVESPMSADKYRVEQLKARSKDGTEVPYFVVRGRDVPSDGTAAALLTGYGGFNISENPRFVSAAGVLLEHGGVYVLANLRGGAEFGESWHQAGMLDRKQNVFDDMAAVARDVVERRIASPERVGVIGASNGGLLASAMVVQQPDLFRVAVARVPLTDMLRYQNFLLAKFWVPEYGSAEDPKMLPVLLAYSPYHNVMPGVRYPAVLLTAGASDGRVDPMHARKMAAALQHATSSEAPVLLRVETKAGHGAGKPISKMVEEYTDVYGFVMSELGLLQGQRGTGASGSGDAQPAR